MSGTSTKRDDIVILAIINLLVIVGVLGWLTWVLHAHATTFDKTEVESIVKTAPVIIAACLSTTTAALLRSK